jgi:TPR repeat protein
MNSPSSKNPASSNDGSDYSPLWARDRARPVLEEPVSLPVEKWPRNETATRANRDSLDDLACYLRATKRIGIVCAVAAIVVVAAVLLLLNPKQAHKSVQANASPPWATSENQALASAEAVRIVPGLADERSPVASTPPPQRPQRDGSAATAPPQTIASTPTPNQSRLNVDAPPRPAIIQPAVNVKEPAPQPVESISAGSDTSAKTRVAAIPEQQSEASPASKQPLPKPTVTLDDNEIQMLIKRGNNLFKDGDFAAARLLFEQAANAGSAEAALALGSTYDPSVIKQLGAASVTPDLDRALKWYDTAAVRGSADAADRYANLILPAAQLITADGDNGPPQTTGTVAAATFEEPKSKPAEAVHALEGVPPASAPRSLPPQVPNPDSGPQARPSQVPGVQASTTPAPAESDPKLPPSSAESSQIVVGQDRQRLAFEVASRPAVEASAGGGSQRPPLQERRTTRQLKPDEITALISRGSDFLKTGDFSAARVLLQRGAESGSADAALMLGKTFDPLFLHQVGAIGIKPDVAQCRQWYQKAVELGSESAAQRLANLAQTVQ